MIRQVIFLSISIHILSVCNAQTVQVNPDGTHTVIFNNGSTSTQVNPDGTHTQVFHHGSTSTQVYPNGMHSTIFHNGGTSTQVNPDGSHTIIFHHGNTSTQINPDGTHSRIFNSKNDLKYTYSTLPYRKPSNDNINLCYAMDTIQTNRKIHSNDEFTKIKSLLEQEAIDSIDYSILLLRIFNNIYDYSNSTADQLIELKQSSDLDSINTEEYKRKKNTLIYGKEKH